MKQLMESAETLALIESALKGITKDTLLTAKLVAVDSQSMHTFAEARNCDKNDMKPFSFLDQTRADDFCSWVKDESSNPYLDACDAVAGAVRWPRRRGFLAAPTGGIRRR